MNAQYKHLSGGVKLHHLSSSNKILPLIPVSKDAQKETKTWNKKLVGQHGSIRSYGKLPTSFFNLRLM